nr:immunoglobulin light chain junction region [Macaca mulatta]MOV98236.1 immunoglobulin light chain junction region [Macaca mulatta]MOV98817.1 immunoglobulin light chain junction region [Macaca mulatta]MOV99301.1 immunoglobulin light chain junction region [Macaca mulatta]MOW01476.1 immunoglobulin light chain junction region [Macaca mulatta]
DYYCDSWDSFPTHRVF